MRFLPAFCFSSSLRLRVASPPPAFAGAGFALRRHVLAPGAHRLSRDDLAADGGLDGDDEEVAA
jgi:hypothetical protein